MSENNVVNLGNSPIEFRRCPKDSFTVTQAYYIDNPEMLCPRCETVQYRDFVPHGLIGEHPYKESKKDF